MRGPNVEFAVTHSHMTGHSRQPDRHFYGIGEERRERRGGVALQQPRVVVPFQRPKLGAAPRSNICCAESLYTVRPAAAGSFEPGHSKRKSIWKRLLNEAKIFITLSSLQL